MGGVDRPDRLEYFVRIGEFNFLLIITVNMTGFIRILLGLGVL
jgi:hypothetical protein